MEVFIYDSWGHLSWGSVLFCTMFRNRRPCASLRFKILDPPGMPRHATCEVSHFTGVQRYQGLLIGVYILRGLSDVSMTPGPSQDPVSSVTQTVI